MTVTDTPRAAHDLAEAERLWGPWIARACEAVGVDPDVVDVTEIHALTKEIAHGFSRPMAPVGAFILGVALGQAAPGVDRDALVAALEDTIWTVKSADELPGGEGA